MNLVFIITPPALIENKRSAVLFLDIAAGGSGVAELRAIKARIAQTEKALHMGAYDFAYRSGIRLRLHQVSVFDHYNKNE
ncbi:MAG: hypothetical protein J5871_04595 [Bacteroidales bacterium]|nr:hypothetical protein [Bacteroidales bacterium]